MYPGSKDKWAGSSQPEAGPDAQLGPPLLSAQSQDETGLRVMLWAWGRGLRACRFSSAGGWHTYVYVCGAASHGLHFTHLTLMTSRTQSSLDRTFGELSLQNMSEVRPLKGKQAQDYLCSFLLASQQMASFP